MRSPRLLPSPLFDLPPLSLSLSLSLFLLLLSFSRVTVRRETNADSTVHRRAMPTPPTAVPSDASTSPSAARRPTWRMAGCGGYEWDPFAGMLPVTYLRSMRKQLDYPHSHGRLPERTIL
ncbi:PREDICTED: uncharacterized protein LOC105146207 isoform X2 [Acromyrmex echinatior]|uniref:uncharacterized protein LOC105146207 isoform X2 n=1 Tax=Acromyrmex echinatior TaxID=103372 RepID=UPI000580E5A9|nr:PREDICTED: uncharacterized protein LOC105146207 isoform X2 [Acromyrmex echinatior]